MFEKPVLFVIGAGASSDFRFPLGSTFGARIADALRMDDEPDEIQFIEPRIRSAIEIYSTEFEELRHNPSKNLEAAKAVRNAMMVSPSIDAFLETHSDREHIVTTGKLAISHQILMCESSAVHHDFSSSTDTFQNRSLSTETWFGPFFDMLVEGITLENIDHIFDNVTLVVFNYDRCVEQLLFFALQYRFLISFEKSASLINSLKIFHPYGQVGWLPWQYRNEEGQVQDAEMNEESVAYGEACEGLKLLQVSRQIYTFSERRDQPHWIGDLARAVCNADLIVFLGFGFHLPNMDLLNPKLSGADLKGTLATTRPMNVFPKKPFVVGTNHMMSEEMKMAATLRIQQLLVDITGASMEAPTSSMNFSIKLEDKTCGQFLRDNKLGISLSELR